ncbi:calcium-binding protein [Tropicimonas aquimaris]|uniref:Calcium-binding protein n=1 Tax=Tropicimonas aquimaris TaxID=914152 RepID=A0ABW3IXS0_9RHOB
MLLDIPQPDPTNFTTIIDNPFMTLRPGTTFFLEKPEDGEQVSVTVTHQTRVVDGVTCVVVHDVERVNGLVVEDTYDWYAQDAGGNVWYFGEETAEYEPGSDTPETTDGSWEAGIDGARAGIVMLAEPEVGLRYYQEFYEGEAEDWAVVQSLDDTVNVRYGDFEEVLRTRDVNPLDPSEERKFYVEGVGLVLATDEEGGREALTRIEVHGRDGDDRLLGYSGGDSLFGRGGSDILRGLEGNDILAGQRGADSLRGGKGFDVLRGGGGNDTLRGGVGGDTFVFGRFDNGRAETETIADYDIEQLDMIRLAGGSASVASQVETADGWELTMAGDGDVLRILGVEDAEGDGQIFDDLLFV